MPFGHVATRWLTKTGDSAQISTCFDLVQVERVRQQSEDECLRFYDSNRKLVHDPTHDLQEQRAVSKCVTNDTGPCIFSMLNDESKSAARRNHPNHIP